MKTEKTKKIKHYPVGELDTGRLAMHVILQAITDVEDENIDTLSRVQALRWLQGYSESDQKDLDLWTMLAGIDANMIQNKYRYYKFLGNKLIVSANNERRKK